MKPKKFDKKLSLNKKTVSDLNSREMGNVHGGLIDTTAMIEDCTISITLLTQVCACPPPPRITRDGSYTCIDIIKCR